MIKTYEKMLVQEQNLGLYSGDIAIIPDPLNGHPKLNWSGSIIDIDQFRIALSFLKWTHDEHHVEGQIRLFYNEFTRAWKAVALPQYIWSAGHTREVEEDDPTKSKIIEDLLNSGFGQAGTGHHHSGMGAFQSGGDLEDELGQSGFHFTVGHMSADVADFHCRATFRKINYDPNKEMLNPSQWLPGLHNKHLADREIAALWLDLKNLPPFPEEWKKYLVKKPEETRTTWTSQGWKGAGATTSTEQLMFRDGYACIRFKPCESPYIHRFWIIPKPVKAVGAIVTPATTSAADITKPIDTTPAATTPVLTQAEINQKKLEELEAKKNAEQTMLSTLIEKVSDMDQVAFEEFCNTLRTAGNARRLEKLPKNALDTPRGRVIDRLEECLAEFRDSAVPDSGDVTDLQNYFDAMQDLSRQFVRVIESTVGKHKVYFQPEDPKRLTELLIKWGNALFEQILMQATPSEWEAICTECAKPNLAAVDFYDAMIIGLKRAVAQETIDDIYEDDGTLLLTIHHC